MRWQQRSVVDLLASGEWTSASRRLLPSVTFVASVLAAALFLFTPPPGPAQADEIVEGGDVFDIGEAGEKGMSATNPRVKSMLDAHPNELVTICVAGCDGKPSIVQALPKPTEKRIGEMRTTAGSMEGMRGGLPAYPAGFEASDPDTVTCVAGCGGAPGRVLQRMPGLPPLPKAPPPEHADAGDEPKAAGNEPLDVGR